MNPWMIDLINMDLTLLVISIAGLVIVALKISYFYFRRKMRRKLAEKSIEEIRSK